MLSVFVRPLFLVLTILSTAHSDGFEKEVFKVRDMGNLISGIIVFMPFNAALVVDHWCLSWKV